MTRLTKKLTLDKAQEDILSLIKNGKAEDMTLDEIKDNVGLQSSPAVFYKIKQLETKGYIRKDEQGKYIALEKPIDDVYYFPFIGFAYCGHLKDNDFSVSQIREHIPFPTKEISLSNPQDITKYFFTRAIGDSMMPKINEGDLLLIKLQQESNPNDSSLVLHNGIPKIKNLHNKDGMYILVSLNKNIPDYEIVADNEELEVIGIVKKVISST